jgi:hypothetical protein
MNDTEYVALVETAREELRDHIALARNRFDRLIRTADPLARPPGSDWTVQQVVAHVLTVAHRYVQFARGLLPRRRSVGACTDRHTRRGQEVDGRTAVVDPRSR